MRIQRTAKLLLKGNLYVNKALEAGVIKKVEDIVLDNESKRAFREGVMLESSLSCLDLYTIRFDLTEPSRVQ